MPTFTEINKETGFKNGDRENRDQSIIQAIEHLCKGNLAFLITGL